MQEYIHYGHKEFNKERFTKVTNEHCWVKPNGGLWASPVDAKFGWKDWCEAEMFRDCDEDNSFRFTLTEDSNVCHLYSVEDLHKLPRQSNCYIVSNYCIDFEKLIEMGYDAVELHLSDDIETGLGNGLYWELYGWDCDSIVILNPDIICPKPACLGTSGNLCK
jgi:hypothetical protein